MKAVNYLGTALVCMTIGASLSYAAERTYSFSLEADEITLHNYMQPYHQLDLNEIRHITFDLTVDNSSKSTNEVQELNNLIISFPNAPDLTVTSLKPVDSNSIPMHYGPCNGQMFYTTVDAVWLYRSLEVALCTDFHNEDNAASLLYQVAIRNSENYSSNNLFQDSIPLFNGEGIAVDKTENKVVDKIDTSYLNKDITIELLQKPTAYHDPLTDSGIGVGFIINTSWLGHGDKTLVLPTGNNYDIFSTAVTLIVDEVPAPRPLEKDIWIHVKYIDSIGNERYSTTLNLHKLLEASYGPLN